MKPHIASALWVCLVLVCSGCASIHTAVSDGDLAGVQALVDGNPSLLNDRDPRQQNTPLHEAANRGRTEIVSYLLSKGADPNAQNVSGETPLHMAANMEIARLMIKAGANVNAEDNDGRPPLLSILEKKSASIDMIQLLLDSGAKANATDAKGATALHLCSDPDLVELFVKRGADVNAKDMSGNTPLHEAYKSRKTNNVEALMRHGADASLTNLGGATPFDLLYPRFPGSDGIPAKDFALLKFEQGDDNGQVIATQIQREGQGNNANSPRNSFDGYQLPPGRYALALAYLCSAGSVSDWKYTEPRTVRITAEAGHTYVAGYLLQTNNRVLVGVHDYGLRDSANVAELISRPTHFLPEGVAVPTFLPAGLLDGVTSVRFTIKTLKADGKVRGQQYPATTLRNVLCEITKDGVTYSVTIGGASFAVSSPNSQGTVDALTLVSVAAGDKDLSLPAQKAAFLKELQTLFGNHADLRNVSVKMNDEPVPLR